MKNPGREFVITLGKKGNKMSNTTWECDNCGFEKNTGNFCGMCGSARTQRKEGRLQKLTCEMCGGNDIVKENGLYVCQHCGTKYSVEAY